MEKQCSEENHKIEKAYSGLQSHPYHLHAICVHDGNANSGHYYALIKDRFNNKWRKFNDIRVTEISEEEVFKESNGGHGWMTAFFVLYINPTIARELDNFDIYHYAPPEKQDADYMSPQIYANMIPGLINIQIDDENLKLKELILNHKAEQIVKEVQKSYDEKYSIVNEIWSTSKKIEEKTQPKTPELAYIEHIKFAHLLFYLAYFKEENIMKNVLLDYCFKEEWAKYCKTHSMLEAESQ